MKVSLSLVEYALVVMILMLVPILFLELVGVGQMRSINKAFHDDTEGMPQLADLRIGGAVSLLLIGVRLVAIKTFSPLARIVLSPKKRVVEERVQRFATVLFKFMYVILL